MANEMNILGRIPPHNIEAEQAVLGSMMLDNEAIPVVVEILKSDDFYRQDHGEIYEAILDLFNKAEPVDIVTVIEQLKSRGTLDKAGGLEYITNIAVSVPTTANVKHYASIVEEKSILRKLIKAASQIVDFSYEASEEVSVILDRAEKNIFDILQGRSSKGFYHVKEILVEAFNRLEELYSKRELIDGIPSGFITGVPSGFIDLDYKTAGFQNSDLVLVASRPSMGKTSFALNIAQYAAIYKRVPVAIFSLEMSKEQLVNRILCSEALIDSQKMRTGNLDDEDWDSIARALDPLSEAPIYIDDTPGISVAEIRAKCRRLKLEKDLGLVIIDYLQLMQGRGRAENRQQEISEISRSLKILAKEINVPVITLSQLSRAPETRADHRPILSDLRESGAIEQDADMVLFIYRDDYYNQDSDRKNIAEIIIAKHRNGSTGTVELAWLGQYTKFANLKKILTGKG
ncbi:MAG: replicative DNA helicase [Clostridiaceae bacterium]|nr:replicative DNA helicase [Clostridiaceae bacterium]